MGCCLVETLFSYLYFLLVSWLKSLHPVVKQKNHCHELKFHVKSFRTYCDRVGRTLADLMEDGVKVLSLYLDCFGKTSWLPVSPSVWLVLFLSTGGLFLCLVGFLRCFHLPPCYLTCLVTNGDLLFLLLFFLPVRLIHLSCEMDWSYPFVLLKWVCNSMPSEYAVLWA